jgi:AraC family transcriptional regulator
MHPPTVLNNTHSTAATAFLASLIESAVASFDVDPAVSLEHLFRAFAILRAQVPRPTAMTPVLPRGLATWQAKRVIAYIEDNLTTEIRTKDLAKLANLTSSHFSRSFKVSIGLPPLAYITQRRINLARTLMRTTADPLCQIALSCGSYDQSHFCRVFRRIVGQTPSQWRRENATGPGAA